MCMDSSHPIDTACEPEPDLLILREDFPLYADMLELARRGAEGKIEFLSYEQVWGEETE